MHNVVKNTGRCGVFDIICPHRCRGCGRIGSVLCECCKNEILCGNLNICPNCGKVINYRCSECGLPFFMTFVMGGRMDLLGRMAEEFKFYSVRAMAESIAGVIDGMLPEIEGKIVLVPMPTIQRHIRERGLDHTQRICEELAKKRGWKVDRLLERNKNTVQVGANARQRKKQAKEAYRFVPHHEMDVETTYILFDDIWTTGASMMEAGKLLRENGVKNIAMIVIAKSEDKNIKNEKIKR